MTYGPADELRDLQQSVLACRTLADLRSVQITIERILAASIGTIPGAAYWNDCATIIAAYLAARRDEQAEVVCDDEPISPGMQAVIDGTKAKIRAAFADTTTSPAVAAGGVTEEMLKSALAASASQYEVACNLQASSPESYAECFGEATPPELAMRAALTAALAVGDEGIREALARIIDANDDYLRHNPHGEPDALTVACDAARRFLPTPPSRGEGE